MTPISSVDAACRVIREDGKQCGYDVTIYIKHDDRIIIALAGHRPLQEPGAALLALAERLAR